MIIRRKKRRGNYTVIGNEIFHSGLPLDAIGLHNYLMSRPDDWQVSLRNLQGHFSAGRDKIQRIFRDLIAAGYVKHTRLKDGNSNQFAGGDYTVFEEPQPLDDDTDENAITRGNSPQPENPVAGQPQPEKPQPEIPVEVLSTEQTKLSPKKGVFTKSSIEPDAIAPTALDEPDPDTPSAQSVLSFEKFENDWPWIPSENRVTARKAFDKLDQSDRWAAWTNIQSFNAWMKSADRRQVSASGYLRGQRWKNVEGIGEPKEPTTQKRVFVEKGSPGWECCVARFRQARDGRSPPADYQRDGVFGWDFPDEWLESTAESVCKWTAGQGTQGKRLSAGQRHSPRKVRSEHSQT